MQIVGIEIDGEVKHGKEHLFLKCLLLILEVAIFLLRFTTIWIVGSHCYAVCCNTFKRNFTVNLSHLWKDI